MRIVHLGPFDAARTAWHMSQAIRRHAPIHESLTILQSAATPCDIAWETDAARGEELLAAADVIIFHCGIWDWGGKSQGSDKAFLGIDTHEVPQWKRWADPSRAVIWLDGSTAVRHEPNKWRERYQGYRICATNPDVADMYGAEWVPACVAPDVDLGRLSRPAVDRDKRILVHPYTDVELKGHRHVVNAVSGHPKWECRPVQGRAHLDCIAEMVVGDCVVDHFQGYFGVVTLEATALGRPVLLRIDPLTAQTMARYGWPVPASWIHVESEGRLGYWLAALGDAPLDLWHEYHDLARQWWANFGRNEHRIERFIEWLSRS